MIRLHVTYPFVSGSEFGTLNCTTAGSTTYTDNLNFGVAMYVPWQYMHKDEHFDITEKWFGDHLSEEFPDIPHIPRNCWHSKLDASIRVRPRIKHSGTRTFHPYGWDSDRYVEDSGSDLFPKDHPYILHGGTRPIRPITDLPNPCQYPILNTAQVTLVTLRRDRYHSMAPWQYYQVVLGKVIIPIDLHTGNRVENIPGAIIYDYSFSTRWEAGIEESWSSDETCTLDLHGTKLHWDFLNGEWKSGYPYNRIFRSQLSTSEVRAVFKSNPVIPSRFKLPTSPPWDWTPAGEPLEHVSVYGFDKKKFRSDLYPVLASAINSVACRAASVSLPRSTHQKDLHLQLIQDLSVFDSNLLLYFKDLPSVGGSVSTLVSALRSRNFSDISAVWLTMRFADRLTFADTKELRASVDKALERRSIVLNRLIKRHARDTQSYTVTTDFGEVRVTELWNSSAFFKPRVSQDQQAFDKLRLLCQEWDIISLENAWDSVPYSFVVDWIVDVAGCLNILDRNVQMWAYEITRIWDSVKRTIDVSPLLPRFSSMDITVDYLRYSQYSRISPESMKLPVFTSPLEPIGEGLHNWKHIVDIGMLVIQRL